MLDEIINITSLLYTELWQFWYESKTNENVLFNSFRDIEKLINNNIFRANSDNEDSFFNIQNNLRRIIIELNILIDRIITIRKEKNQHGKNRLLKVYRLRLKNINNKLFNE